MRLNSFILGDGLISYSCVVREKTPKWPEQKRCWWESSTKFIFFSRKLQHNGKLKLNTLYLLCIQLLDIQTKAKRTFTILFALYYLLFVVRFYDCRKKESREKKERERKKANKHAKSVYIMKRLTFQLWITIFHIFFFSVFRTNPTNDVNPKSKAFLSCLCVTHARTPIMLKIP